MAKLNLQTLEERINIRANEVVQIKINKFKKAIESALTELFGSTGMGGEQFGQLGYFEGSKGKDKEVGRMRLEGLKLAICDYKTPFEKHYDTKVFLPWPSQLWDKERDAIRTELLAKMDLLQQLLLTKERNSDADVPEGDLKETT